MQKGLIMILKEQSIFYSITSILILSLIIIFSVYYFINRKELIGPIIFISGFLPWIPIKFSGRTIRSTGADIVFGAIDTGILGIAALIGANFAGVLGAIVGGAIGDSITDALAGLFEGKMAERLRRLGIEELRTPLSSSMGKMSGCLLGVGLVLTFTWSLIGIDV